MLMVYLSMLDSQGHKDKFEAIYVEYKSLMLYIAYSVLHDEHLAEDAVHNAFMYMAEILDDIRTDNQRELKAVVVIMAKNKAIDLLRTMNRKSKQAEAEVPAGGAEAPAAEQVAIDGMLFEQLVQAIDAMDEAYRLPMTLKAQGYRMAEIAKILQMNENTVRVRLHRARKLLEKQLKIGEGDG